MSYKEWEAVVGIIASIVIAAWVIFEALTNPPATVVTVASRLLWAILYGVLFNIAAMIVTAILVSIARRSEFKDEKADERDKAVGLRAMRNGYVIASITGIATLFYLAFGADPALAAYVLFGGLMLAGLVDSTSRLIYYRIG
ncbi:MAG TPA: hypothetical protein VGV07_26425 [Devosia sp.]|jgi:small-conductance mechanosensitive channel|uniref:hypothetical protein n=1 Tax=Devosia sp. TaxID=1871048 RepID=UPI002DDCB3F6|nr:hypothetical protein [Devosia sp.]HEV2518811.1 hypothetical protein [Devosia sp.]